MVNSWVYENGAPQTGLEPWKMAVIGIDAVIGLLLIGAEVLMVRGYLRRRRG